jgi:hypothetical protein
MNKLTDKFINDFKSKNLNLTDQIIISIHLTIVLIIYLTYQLKDSDKDLLKTFTHLYIFISPLLLVGLLFRRLRKVKFYLVWLIISIIQIFIYPIVKDIPDFSFYNGTAFSGLTSMLPTLILFQIFRQVFYLLKGQEMIISIRHYRFSMYEEEDKRNMTWIEVVFSFLLSLTAIFSGDILT